MSNMFLYIDPGTGSMLFSLFIGLAAAATFGFRGLYLKLKFLFSGGKNTETASDTIPYVIFSDHKRYWNVFKPICDEFEKRKLDVTYYTASPDDPVLEAEYKYVHAEYLGEKNKPFAKLNFINADILIATTPNLGVYQWKRSKYVKLYVHIPHTVDDLSGYRMFGLDHYDVVLTTGENQQKLIRKIESLRPSIVRKELVNIGSITLDNLKEKYESAKCPEKKEKVVLVAPSWGKNGILSKYGETCLNAVSNIGYRVIIRPHPQTIVSEQNVLKPLKEKFSNLEWNFDNDNFNVLNMADILITDFSGIIFDYTLVFDKPVIYADTSFDSSVYDADWLDEKMWSLRILPELGKELKECDFNNMKSLISEVIQSNEYAEGRKKILSECWVNVGKSAETAVDWLIQRRETL